MMLSRSDMRVEFVGNGWEKFSDMFHLGINTTELWAAMTSIVTETHNFRLLAFTVIIDHFQQWWTVFGGADSKSVLIQNVLAAATESISDLNAFSS